MTHEKADSDVGFFVSVVLEIRMAGPPLTQNLTLQKRLTVFEDPSYMNPFSLLLTCSPIARVQTRDGFAIALPILCA